MENIRNKVYERFDYFGFKNRILLAALIFDRNVLEGSNISVNRFLIIQIIKRKDFDITENVLNNIKQYIKDGKY